MQSHEFILYYDTVNGHLVRKARLNKRSRQSSYSDIAIIFGLETGSGCKVLVTHKVVFYSVLQLTWFYL